MNIAFLPIRCGSKSISFKNIKLFCNKPLAYWSLKALEKSHSIDKIFVATDCEKISLIIKNFNFSKVEVYKRDQENAKDTSSTESVMMEFINKNNFGDNDYFVLVQATSPLTETKDFDEAFSLLKKERSDSLLTCTRQKIFFWNKTGNSLNYDYKDRPRRQDFEGVLVENGAFYINTVKNIKNFQNRLSKKISIYEMEEFKAVDIDEESDWLIAEKLMNKYILEKK